MTPARRRALGGTLLVLFLAGLVAAALNVHPRPKPTLLLLTSLPLVFGEDFSLEETGSPALDALKRDYRVVPISTTAAPELARGRLLLMAQPLGQSPEDLVALDRWLRSGGALMLLADPLLEWPSKHPLGHPLRPPTTFVDTGLLGHWGLRLDAPDVRGPKRFSLGAQPVETVSPGSLSGRCAIGADQLVARCAIGKGRAFVVADADLLDVDELGPGAKQNLDWLRDELASASGN